jgi:RNA polymerase sigma-70 factor (ECF subfamily)
MDSRAGRRAVREPEPETILRARAGDLSAFETLVRDYQADVWRFAYHLTRDRARAEDVTQEAFLRVFRAIGTFRGDAKFSSWLLRIVRNCAIDSYRAVRREAPVLSRPDAEEGTPPASSGGSLAEERMGLHDAIRRLPMDLREPFVVIEVLGYTYREASVILGVRVGTIKSRMHRARATLVRMLDTGEAAREV